MNELKLSSWLFAGIMLATAAVPAGAADPAAPASAASSAQPAMPPAQCMAALDRLSADIPLAETGPELRRMGLRIQTPIVVPEGAVTETGTVSAARVRVMIDASGAVVPGSVEVQQSFGDPKLPLALSQAVPATLRFDVSAAFSMPKEFAFTTVYVVCARK